MDLVVAILLAIWIMLPAYLPNNVAVLVGGGPAIDGGRTWRGARLLGNGKTWRGTIGGILAGVGLALVLNIVANPVSSGTGIELPTFSVGIMLAFPLGALLGDMAASFLKRRTGRERGAAFPFVDQLDFLLGALVLGVLVDPTWMRDVFTPLLLAIVIILTPLLHVITNVIAYQLDLKSEPW